MMQRQQKGRVGAGRLARKLGPALWIAAALVTGSCAGRPAAPPANPLGAGVVVAVANRAETAEWSEGSATREPGQTRETREPQAAGAADVAIAVKQAPGASFSVTPTAAQVDVAPLAAARETAVATALVPAVMPAPTATAIPSAPSPSITPQTPAATLAPSATPIPPTNTPAPAPQFRVLENANVRAGPGTAYPIVGGVAAGDNYSLAARNADGSWLQFTYGNATGWVSAGLVSATGELASVPVPANIPPPPPTSTKAPPTRTPAPGPGDPVIADLVARINKARADAGLNQLRWTPELAQAAGAHTWDMATHRFFSHTGSDGSDVTVRMRRAGYIPVYWGEILTHINGGGGPDVAFSAFWNSPHHHDIILGDKFTDVGAAWIKDPADGRFNYYAVVFGRR